QGGCGSRSEPRPGKRTGHGHFFAPASGLQRREGGPFVLVFSRPTRALMVLGLVASGGLVWLYVSGFHHLAAAREARRSDDGAAAESHLAACWRLPGFASTARLEEELLGVQQGDLRNEKELQARAARWSAESELILESLAKGCLATSQFNEARTYADA